MILISERPKKCKIKIPNVSCSYIPKCNHWAWQQYRNYKDMIVLYVPKYLCSCWRWKNCHNAGATDAWSNYFLLNSPLDCPWTHRDYELQWVNSRGSLSIRVILQVCFRLKPLVQSMAHSVVIRAKLSICTTHSNFNYYFDAASIFFQ